MHVGAKIVLFFFVFYSLFGLYLTIEKGTPNNTNDFLFHYYKAKGEFNSELTPYYSQESISIYPSFLHGLTKYFTYSKFTYYLFFVFLIIGVMPYLLYKIAGEKAIILYFLGVSLPHMALYSAVFASILVLTFLLVYLNYRKNIILWGILAFLASITHKEGLILFLFVGSAEVIAHYFKDKELISPGFLIGVNILTPFKIIELFLVHTNFILIWLARKNFDLFYSLLFIISLIGTKFDLRVMNLAQIILCVVLAKNNFDKKTWLLLILLGFWNTFNFCFGTASFIY